MNLRISGIKLPGIKSTNQEEVSRSLYNLGVRHFNKEQYDVANAYFSDTIDYIRTEEPNTPRIREERRQMISKLYNNQGVIYHLKGSDSSAISFFECALREDPSLEEAAENLEALTKAAVK